MSTHECPHCSESFDNQFQLCRHVASACCWFDEQGLGTRNSYTCPECMKSFRSTVQLQQHLLCHEHTRSLIMQATVCESTTMKNLCDANANATDKSQPAQIHEAKRISSHVEDQPVESFQCDMCPRSFDAKIKLQRHVSYHKKHHQEMFHCGRCSQFFLKWSTWKTHENMHRRFDARKRQDAVSMPVTSDYACSRCYRRFDCRFMLEHHEKSHVAVDKRKSRVFCCSHCSRTFASSALLREHETSHSEHPSTGHICQLCNKRYLYQSILYKHMERVHSREELSGIGPVHACLKCSQIFVEAGRLREHELQMHAETDAKDSGSGLTHGSANMYVCSECGRSMKSQTALTFHLRTHSGVRPYQCRAGCSRTFAQHSTRAYHERTHSDAMPHICSQCGLAFKHSTMLRLHSRLHAGIRPHKCPSCPKAYHKSSQLLQHMRCHTGERPYICAACPKQFSLRTQLVRHQNAVHRQLKPWQCSVCDKTFTQPGNLRIHMRVHTNEKPFACSICKLRFSYSTALKSHMRKHDERQMF